MKNRILIEVSGGLVSRVSARLDTIVEVAILDWDRIEADLDYNGRTKHLDTLMQGVEFDAWKWRDGKDDPDSLSFDGFDVHPLDPQSDNLDVTKE